MMDEIEQCIQANCPILYVVSKEETRFLRELEKSCVGKRRKLWIHTISEGLWNIAFSKQRELWYEASKGRVHEELRDPIALLEHLKGVRFNEGVFLLVDFHEALKDALVRRLLKDVALRFLESKSHIVILAPVLGIPKSLEHEVNVLDFPLPSKTELSEVFKAALKTLKKKKLQINLTGGEKEKVVTAGQGMTMNQFEDCLAKAVVKGGGKIDAKIVDEIISGKKQILKQGGLLEFFDSMDTVEHIGGFTALKGWLAKRQHAFSEEARAFGLPNPKGILLLGVPGSGKSLSAKACSSLWKFPLLRLDMGRLFSSQVGSSENNVREVIRLAEAMAPCILFIDEIDKSFAGVASSAYSDAGTTARTIGSFLTWMQEKQGPVFIVATANNIESLLPEMLRKGRFDEIWFLDLPGLGEREEIIRIHLKKRNRNPDDFDIRYIAENCENLSGAEIEQGIVSGLFDAFDSNRLLTTDDIIRNLKNQIPLSTTMAEEIQALRNWARTRARFASEDVVEQKRRQWRTGNVRPL